MNDQQRAMESVIRQYDYLRARCWMEMRNSPELLGPDSWLLYAISENDINLDWTTDGISCYGSCYSMQTMGHEWFEFTIPFELLKGV